VTPIVKAFVRLLHDEEAPTMAEYGLLLVLIALFAFAAIVGLGQGISTLFENTGAPLKNASLPTIP
jgi:Flp pilus assembly pilin Flp